MISQRKCILADRYVPIRKDLSSDFLATASHFTSEKDSKIDNSSYAKLIKNQQKRCLSFKKKTLTSTQYTDMHLAKNPIQRLKTIKIDLKLTKTVKNFQVLEAPNVIDSFYHNVMDWSKDEIICIALENECFFRYKNKQFVKLSFGRNYLDSSQDNISSIKFNNEGRLVYLGDQQGIIQIFDTETAKPLRKINDHFSRVSCLENTFDWGFLSGSKDKCIVHHDTRLKRSRIFKLFAHRQEVCGLTINNNKVASSSNDGRIFLWNLTNEKNIVQSHFLHRDAVKAIKWCPWKVNLLASGGGKNDHKIILWNTQKQAVQEILQGNTQITSLQWNQKTKDLITAHSGSKKGGYITVWNYQIKQFTHLLAGHSKRIVSMCLNPMNKNEISSVGADQTLRFWNIRNQQPQNVKRQIIKPKISQDIIIK